MKLRSALAAGLAALGLTFGSIGTAVAAPDPGATTQAYVYGTESWSFVPKAGAGTVYVSIYWRATSSTTNTRQVTGVTLQNTGATPANFQLRDNGAGSALRAANVGPYQTQTTPFTVLTSYDRTVYVSGGFSSSMSPFYAIRCE